MKLNKSLIGWMMYDFANSAFTTIIVSVVYSVYFVHNVVSGNSGYGEMLWGRAIGISMAMVAVSAPILGAVADYSRAKKRLLFVNCYLTVIFTALLYFVKAGDVFIGMLFFIVANFGFNSANVFYDSFLPDIAKPEDIGRVSGYGWALGYIGGLVSLGYTLLLLKYNVRWVFPAIAVHFFVFPCLPFSGSRNTVVPQPELTTLGLPGNGSPFPSNIFANCPSLRDSSSAISSTMMGSRR